MTFARGGVTRSSKTDRRNVVKSVKRKITTYRVLELALRQIYDQINGFNLENIRGDVPEIYRASLSLNLLS